MPRTLTYISKTQGHNTITDATKLNTQTVKRGTKQQARQQFKGGRRDETEAKNKGLCLSVRLQGLYNWSRTGTPPPANFLLAEPRPRLARAGSHKTE